MNKTLLIITGPTASGKTDLSIRIAKHFETEILSSDSRQFYRGLNIGTAKPDAEQLGQATHHFIDFLDVTEDYNIGRYEADALNCLEKIFTKHDQAVLTGGSGLYIDAVSKGMDELPESDPALRAQLEQLLKIQGIEELQARLKILDPDYYETVDLKNPHRLIRAIEVCILSGRAFSSLRSNRKAERPFRSVKIGLLLDRDELYERINRRVDLMIEQGLMEEARRFFPQRDLNALRTVGYQELFLHFEGKCTEKEAIELIKKNTRNYARRQMTWMRRDQDIHWFQPDEEASIIRFLEKECSK